MSIKDLLQNELAKHTSGGPYTIAVQEQDKKLICSIAEANPLAYRIDRFVLETSALANVSMDRLQKISEDLAGRVNYLLEPIGPVERDHDQCVVQMRSNPPQRDDDGSQYYELLVRQGGELELCRYQKQPGQPRQTVSALLTSETLVRLANDFSGVVD